MICPATVTEYGSQIGLSPLSIRAMQVAMVDLPLPGGPYRNSECPALIAGPMRRWKLSGSTSSLSASLTVSGRTTSACSVCRRIAWV